MDAPQIKYARTDDGVNIAYWTLGEGPPLVQIQNPFVSKLDQEWEVPAFRSWYERLADRFRLIRFDFRGGGLSTKTAEGLDLEGKFRDLDAVLAATEIDRTHMFGWHDIGQVALAFAARSPERVGRIALFATPLTLPDQPAVNLTAGKAMWYADHDLWVDTQMQWVMAGESDTDGSMRQLISSGIPADSDYRLQRAMGALHVVDLLDKVTAPVLVLDLVQNPWFGDSAQRLTAALPDARLQTFPGRSPLPMLVDADGIAQAAIAFLSDEGESGQRAGGDVQGFRAILFTDVVASTPLLAQLKDAKMREVMRDHDAVLNAAIAEHGGRIIKEIGDAFMAEFVVPSAAVEAAIAIQRGIRDQFADSDVPIRLRIGINAGEPVVEDGDLHGASVVIAKRLESAAPTNGILVSDVVKQAVVGKDFEFVDQGEVELKGFDDAVRAWSVEWV